MKEKTQYMSLMLVVVACLLWVGSASAEVYVQCPCYKLDAQGKPDPTQLAQNGDVIAGNTLLADATYNTVTGNVECTYNDSQIPPVTHNAACKSLAAGDGHIQMADGNDLYIFGFDDVTGVARDNIMNMADDPINPGGMRGMEGPAPTIIAKQGQELYLSLTNVSMFERPDLFDPHTVHYHGFPNAASVFDGEPMASVAITMGNTFTYYYNNVEPGTYMYHCHVEASEHMQMGMLGNLFVTPAQDGTNPGGCTCPSQTYAYNDGDCSTCYDVAYPILMEGFDPKFHLADQSYNALDFGNMDDTYLAFNGRGYPDTVNPCPKAASYPTATPAGFPACTSPIVNSLGIQSQNVSSLITAAAGQKILLHIASLSTTDFFSVSVLGMPMKVIGRGARLLRGPTGKDLSYTTNSITLGGGEAFDVMLDTTGIPPGTYFMYTKNLNHLTNDSEDFGGMMTEIVLN